MLPAVDEKPQSLPNITFAAPAEAYEGPWQHVVEHVKPQREALPASKAKLRELFWIYEARAKSVKFSPQHR